MIQVFLKYRKQKPIFFVDVGLPGNVDTEISKISNCYLFDLNDLEQFFTLFFNESNIEKLLNYGQFSKEDDKVFSYFFKKLNFSENQKKIFKNYVEDFFFENNEEYQKDAFLKFLNHLSRTMEYKKLESVQIKFRDLEEKINSLNKDNYKEFARLSKEYSDLKPLVEKINIYFKLLTELDDLDDLLESEDSDLKIEAEKEKDDLNSKINKLNNEIKFLLIPKDESDEKNAIIEIRAGTGGEEAALFASDLFRMYVKFSELKKWKTEIMDISQTDHDGIKEVVINVSGDEVFGTLKFESGTHRVQRVPETESGGRIHTSAATVAVLPEATDVDVDILEKDLRIDIFRSSGPGGQSVNTTDSAVRITHVPTGTVAQCQDEKSQHKNKAKALTVLRSRIFEVERQKKEAERALNRKSQVGSGDRSERIRTYNFPQGRVTDHRISMTLYKLDQILNGEGLEEIINGLIADDNVKKLAE